MASPTMYSQVNTKRTAPTRPNRFTLSDNPTYVRRMIIETVHPVDAITVPYNTPTTETSPPENR